MLPFCFPPPVHRVAKLLAGKGGANVSRTHYILKNIKNYITVFRNRFREEAGNHSEEATYLHAICFILHNI